MPFPSHDLPRGTRPLFRRTTTEASELLRPLFRRTVTQESHELRHLIDGDEELPMADDADLENVKHGDSKGAGLATRHAILDDPELDGLTLYEKKALLVNRELDEHGMGKYQWYIFFLCGFGYLLDLLYAQAFGLVAPAIQQEFGFGGTEIPHHS